MPSNQIRKTGADPAAKADSKSTGITVDPGPYEAIVMAHVPGTRMGQLQVYIPDWGGKKTDSSNQIVVSYASPFYGTTYGTDAQKGSVSGAHGSYLSGMSYGMWFIPPDVGNKVLVTFAAGDRNRGYWFACIYDSPSHHMVPGLARNVGGNLASGKTLPPNPPDATTAKLNSSESNLPVVEAYSGQSTTYSPDGITSTPRFIHEIQTNILIKQGLDRDKIRGAISSSSLREAPSNVYGISTPGRALGNPDPTASGENKSQAYRVRMGGHQFVMDDGDAKGNDQLIRLRTAGGHQLLMNDTADKTGVLYIASASGQQWIEFSSSGAINIFGNGGINMRSKGPMNFHSDSSILMNSGGSFKINAQSGIAITSTTSASMTGLVSATVASDGFLTLSGMGKASLTAGGMMTVSAGGVLSLVGSMLKLNSGPPGIPKPVTPTMGNQLPDVTFGGTNWQYSPGALQSICTIVPCHEPWIDPSTGKRPKAATGGGAGSMAAGAALSAGAAAGGKLL